MMNSPNLFTGTGKDDSAIWPRQAAILLVTPMTQMIMMTNLLAAWIGLMLGCVAGAIPGLFFHNNDWLGGYASWRRRMMRLGHISFFGIGFINLLFALTARALGLEAGLQGASILLLLGAVAMPTVCYLSAWMPVFRHLFFIPAMSVTIGIALFTWRIIQL